MATDPKTKGKKLNKEQGRADEQKAQDKAKKQKAEKKLPSKKGKKEIALLNGRRRVLPIWLRIILVLLFSAIALLVGLMIGYGVIGDGNPTDALDMETWKHIWKFVTKTE